MAHDVFISYSTEDRTVANAICARLEADGSRCWIAPRDILPGTTWGGSIVRAISETRVMVLILSASANDSPQILREVERAVSRGVVVVPVRIEDVIPADDLEFFISSAHWLDAVTAPVDQHLDRIADVVRRVLEGLKGPAEAAQPRSAVHPPPPTASPPTASPPAAGPPAASPPAAGPPAATQPPAGRPAVAPTTAGRLPRWFIGVGLVGAAALLLTRPWGSPAVAGPPARCNDAERIQIGTPISGELWDTDFLRDTRRVDFFSFQLRSREFVEITMESQQVDPYLQLFDAAMAEIEVDDDDGEGLSARIGRLLEPGCYVFGAESYAADAGGPYTVSTRFMPVVAGVGVWVTGIRLYEGSSEAVPFADRVYLNEFDDQTARYVYVELSLTRATDGEEVEFPVECVILHADGTEKGAIEWSPKMEADWKESYSALGWGSETPGWATGTYRVTCTSGGESIAEKFFNVA